MSGRDGLLLWVLGGAGVLFLYAAYTKQHPAAVLSKTLGTAPEAAGNATAQQSPGTTPTLMRPVVDTGNLYDANGNMVGVVPKAYGNTQNTYIPPARMTYA